MFIGNSDLALRPVAAWGPLVFLHGAIFEPGFGLMEGAGGAAAGEEEEEDGEEGAEPPAALTVRRGTPPHNPLVGRKVNPSPGCKIREREGGGAVSPAAF